ncbi:MAG: sigma-70 family RNA polymerase sigma factor [Coriobacteriia bacterium]|nr:sigma-70 family RNA polymerase sigma factor [Coriobacteriia bacterium]
MTIKTGQDYRTEQFLKQAMDLWGSAVYKLAFAQTTSKTDAEDVYQEVFIRLFKHTGAFHESEHLKAWLLRVTLNCCRDLRRSSWKRRITSIEDLKEEPGENSLGAQEAAHDLATALKTLPENMRAVIHLYYYEGYSTEEIAHILDSESSTIRSRLQRARERLKSSLGGTDYGAPTQLLRNDGTDRTACLPEGQGTC